MTYLRDVGVNQKQHKCFYQTTPKGLEALAHIEAVNNLLRPVRQEP